MGRSAPKAGALPGCATPRPRCSSNFTRQFRIRAIARGQWRLKYWTSRSCCSACSRVLKVPRLRRFPVWASFFLEYRRYSPVFSFRIIGSSPFIRDSWHGFAQLSGRLGAGPQHPWCEPLSLPPTAGWRRRGFARSSAPGAKGIQTMPLRCLRVSVRCVLPAIGSEMAGGPSKFWCCPA